MDSVASLPYSVNLNDTSRLYSDENSLEKYVELLLYEIKIGLTIVGDENIRLNVCWLNFYGYRNEGVFICNQYEDSIRGIHSFT